MIKGKGGVAGVAESLIEDNEKIASHTFKLSKKLPGDNGGTIECEVAIVVDSGRDYKGVSYVNCIHTRSGGSHEAGLENGYCKALYEFGERYGKLNIDEVSSWDCTAGLRYVVSLFHPDPEFKSQTKDALRSQDAYEFLSKAAKSEFYNFFRTNRELAVKICEKINAVAKARKADSERWKREVRHLSVGRPKSLPSKLCDCTGHGTGSLSENELFIVEGDSAGGPAKSARNHVNQAILCLKGKPLNTWTATSDKAEANKEVQHIVSCIESGKYDRYIILTDADPDGQHIACLVCAIFFKYYPEIILRGGLYISEAPLFRVKPDGARGNNELWAYSEDEKDGILDSFDKRKAEVTRFKGLGEMSVESLKRTAIDPETRRCYSVVVPSDSGMSHVESCFEELLGKDPSARYEIVTSHDVL